MGRASGAGAGGANGAEAFVPDGLAIRAGFAAPERPFFFASFTVGFAGSAAGGAPFPEPVRSSSIVLRGASPIVRFISAWGWMIAPPAPLITTTPPAGITVLPPVLTADLVGGV
jgi:hypothetical protein